LSPTQPDRSVLEPFFRPDREPSARDAIAGAIEHLREVTAGEITRAELLTSRGKPERGGLLSAQLFGPLEDDTCLCGYVKADPSQRGTTCRKCGVPIGPASMRATRWAHVELAWPMLHPALIPELTALLGWSEAELRSVYGLEARVGSGGEVIPDEETYDDWEASGPEAVARAAEARGGQRAWTVGQLPVPPPADRPLTDVTLPAAGRWAPAGPTITGPDNQVLRTLVNRNNRLARLLELEAPPIILAFEVRKLQRSFEDVLEMLALPADHPRRRPDPDSMWSPMDEDDDSSMCPPGFEPEEPPAVDPDAPLKLGGVPPSLDPDDGDDAPHGLCFVGPDRLLVQRDSTLQLLDIASGEVGWRGQSTPYVLFGAVGERALFGDPYGRADWEGRLAGAAILELSDGRWLREYPADLPATFVEKDQPEEAWLCDWHRRRTAEVEEDTSGDRAQEITRTPDHRFIWVSSDPGDGAVMCAQTAQCHLFLSEMDLLGQSAPVLTVQDLCDGDEEDPEYEESGAVAIARGPDELWRVLDANGGVSVDGEVCFRLPLVATAASFSPDGRRLAVANSIGLVVIDVDKSAVVRRIATGC